MRNCFLLLLMALLFLLFTAPTQVIEPPQKQKIVCAYYTADAPVAYAVLDESTEPPNQPLANRYSPVDSPNHYKTKFNTALEAKPTKVDYGV